MKLDKNNNYIFTDKETLEIFKLAFEYHKKNIKESKLYNHLLNGMCNDIINAIIKLHKEHLLSYYIQKTFPEFKALKPKNGIIWWWSRRNTNRTRIKKYKYLINLYKQKIKK